MKNTKKYLSILLAVLMLWSFLPQAFAAESKPSGKVGDNITWSYSKHTLTLSGKGELSSDLESYDYPWAEYKNSIESVVVKEGVTSIPNGTFAEYRKLAALSLPKSIVDFPLNVMWKTPWYEAQKNGVVYLNGIVCGYKGKMPSDFTLKVKDGTKSVASYAFDSKFALKSVKMPETVSFIGDNAFYYCEHLKDVQIPNELQYVGGYAFAGTPWLNQQPDGVVYLGKIAYAYSGEMQTNTVIQLKKGTKAIAPTAFYGQENLARVQIPESVKTIGYDAFHATGIKTLRIPKSVTKIGGNKVGARFMKKIIVDPENPAYSSDQTGCLFNKKKTQMYEFPGFSKTKYYQIPGTVKNVAALCFDGTQYLETLMIPASVKLIDLYAIHYSETLTAFKVSKKNPNYSSDSNGCLYNKDKTALLRYPVGRTDKSFTVPKQVKRIGSMAFLQAWNLETLKMYDNVTTIGSDAFYRCYSLEAIRFSKNITNIEGQLFSYIPWVDKQPDGVVYIGKVAYSFHGDGKKATIKDGTVSITDHAFAGWNNIKTVVIPKSVKIIGHGAFVDSTGIKTITIYNPKCKLYMEADTFPKQATIYAAKGSTAQAYAEQFGRAFVAI